jgi:hypothetical protein
MYRQGLGDCFLLTFRGDDGAPVFVLIDCGVILGTKNPEKIMTAVAEDVRQRTGGRIHVLVATHEHWDHLSGFVQAQDVFKQITVDTVWLAWTEDPANALAKRLKAQRHRAVRALHLAVQALRARGDAGDMPDQVGEVLGFFGPLGAGGGPGTADALAFLKGHGRHVRYCHPGEAPLALPGVSGVRVYVLGPPEDEARIKKSNPTKKGQEVYTLAEGLSPDRAFFAGVHHRVQGKEPQRGDAEGDVHELSFPFDYGRRVTQARARKDPFFLKHYGFDKQDAEPWRRIDDDWLGAAGPLALQLDSNTNNTSLALAFELAGGQVLLFPGDAQVGNWLSWEDYSWSVAGPDGGRRRVTAADLLAHTVMYKVGHHASHNATLRAKGLERMTSPDLVAMIPVDHKMALKKQWNMPFPHLLSRLKEKAAGRVLRIDSGWEGAAGGGHSGRWQAFGKNVDVTDLAIEYTVLP